MLNSIQRPPSDYDQMRFHVETLHDCVKATLENPDLSSSEKIHALRGVSINLMTVADVALKKGNHGIVMKVKAAFDASVNLMRSQPALQPAVELYTQIAAEPKLNY